MFSLKPMSGHETLITWDIRKMEGGEEVGFSSLRPHLHLQFFAHCKVFSRCMHEPMILWSLHYHEVMYWSICNGFGWRRLDVGDEANQTTPLTGYSRTLATLLLKEHSHVCHVKYFLFVSDCQIFAQHSKFAPLSFNARSVFDLCI